jgi:ankyrin repeat protein
MKTKSISMVTTLLTGLLFFASCETKSSSSLTNSPSSQASAALPNQTQDEDLVRAVRECDATRVKTLLEKGANVNAKDPSKQGETVLAAIIGLVNWADKAKCTEVAKILISNGADVNVKSRWGWPVLTWAALIGNVEIVKALLDKGANVNVKTDKETKSVPVVVKRGSSYDTDFWRPHVEATALIYGVESGDVDTVKALLDKGADINAKDEKSKTVLMYAIEKGDSRIIQLIKEAAAK